MKKYFFFWIIIVTICITLFSACKEHVTDVTLNKQEIYLVIGETETLVATVYPADASNDKVKWKSNNSNVVTVNNNGLVTAVANGETIITATTRDSNKKASCTVSVDYRNKWIGDYDFNINFQIIPPYVPDTTYLYLGSITKSVSYSNKILVDWGDGKIATLNGVTFTQKSELTVNERGVLSYPEYGGFGHFTFGYINSYISGDTIRFGIRAGGLGGWGEWNVIGLKTKQNKNVTR